MNIKSIYILFSSFLSHLVYSQQDTVERCPLAGDRFYFEEGHLMKTKLNSDSTRFGFFVDGKAIGFRFSRGFDCPQVFDEQYSDLFDWSIELNIDSFFYSFSHNQPPPDNFHYLRLHGQRGNPAYKLISINGYIKGIRRGNKWLVEADIEVISKHYTEAMFQRRKLAFSKLFEKPKVKKKFKPLAF